MAVRVANSVLEKKALKMIAAGKASSYTLLGSVKESSFSKNHNLLAFKRQTAHVKKYGTVMSWDELLQDPRLPESAREQLDLYKREPKVNKESVAGVLRLLEQYRKLRTVFDGVKKVGDALVENDTADADELSDILADVIAKTRGKSDTLKTFHIGAGNNSSQLVRDILSGKSLVAIPTGFKDFDSRNRGIFMGSLFVIGGTTGGGKTVLALQLASNFANSGANVCIVSLEMNEEEVLVRNLSRYSRVSMSKLINPETMTKAEKQKVVEGYTNRVNKLKGLNASETIHVPSEDLTIEEILFMLKGYGYDVIIIDYIGLLKNVGGDDSWQKLGDAARFAKVFARNNNCIVILLAQVSGEGVIRYSRAVEENANNAWYFVRDEKSRENHILHMQQKKSRNQQQFNFDLLEDFEFMTIVDLPSVMKERAQKASKERQEEKETPINTRGKKDNVVKFPKQEEPKFKKRVIEDEDNYFSDVG